MPEDVEARLLPVADRASEEPARVDVLGVHVSAVSMVAAVDLIARWIELGQRKYVCVTGVHGVMASQRDPDLMRIHNESGLTTPDGMPLVWCARYAGCSDVTRVCGPDLMLALCERARDQEWSSFFYGAGPGTADLLAARLQARLPGLRIAGTMTPPFQPLTPEEDAEVIDIINRSGADLVWVGLSTPKQERWMATHLGRLDVPVLLGVGAAFDLHAGNCPRAPRWMQRSGLEWSYRLMREPRRLARRYFASNPRFVAQILRRPPRLYARPAKR